MIADTRAMLLTLTLLGSLPFCAPQARGDKKPQASPPAAGAAPVTPGSRAVPKTPTPPAAPPASKTPPALSGALPQSPPATGAAKPEMVPFLVLSPNTAAQSVAPQTADYALGADDIIEITVSNHPDLNRQVLIPPDGKITLPDLGDFVAAGKTRQALGLEIQTAYEKTLNNATVTISAREVHSRKVGITGAVRASNNYDLKRGWRLMDLIAAAGGLIGKPNRVNGRILRNLKNIPVDVSRANAHPDDPDANVPLEAGDIVLLDELTPLRDEVSVLGQVNRVGAYALDDQTTLLTLITQAGGTNEHAALTKAYVRRGKTQMPINLRPALALNENDPKITNFKLEPGDVLMIPEIENRYAVMGQVARPAYYPIPEKGPVTVFEAFNFAGGQLPTGDLSHAGIIRKVDGQATVIPVNMNDVLKKPQIATDITLQPEDILFVPTRGKRGATLQDIFAPLSLLSFLGFRPF